MFSPAINPEGFFVDGYFPPPGWFAVITSASTGGRRDRGRIRLQEIRELDNLRKLRRKAVLSTLLLMAATHPF